jgi:hypothetical protein
MFLPGIRFEPPRAGMIAIFVFAIFDDAVRAVDFGNLLAR